MPYLRSALQFVVVLAWALWFGGTIAVFVFIQHFFKVLPLDAFGQTGTAMFHVFGNYELGLAAAAILAAGLLLVTYPSKGFVIILASLVLAGGMAVTVSLGLTPQIESLYRQGKQHSDEFKKLHGKSMIAMVGQTVILLFTGASLVLTLDPPKPPAVDLDEVDPDLELAARRQSGLTQRV